MGVAAELLRGFFVYMRIKKGLFYKNKKNGMILEITGKHGDHWKTRVMTEKKGVYAGTHTMPEIILKQRYEICDNPLHGRSELDKKIH